jgi:probable lipoprotein NlpC
MLEAALSNLKKSYQQEYGIAVFSVSLKRTKKGFELKGEVLTEKQKNDIINALGNVKIAKENIKVLSKPNKKGEIGWAVVKARTVDLKSRFVSNKMLNGKILKRIRCSQAFNGEILRVLHKNEDQLLVQQNDLTLGWVNRNEVILKKENLYRQWKIGNFAVKDKEVRIDEVLERPVRKLPLQGIPSDSEQRGNDSFWAAKVIKEARKFTGAKYLLGGKSKEGIDCSGLTQAVYKNALNIILPRHSWDQKRVGRKIRLEKVESGDLVFLVKKENSHKHVGIVERSGDRVDLIHASLKKKKVVRQELKEILREYDFVEARRIVED